MEILELFFLTILFKVRNIFVKPFFHFGATIVRCTNENLEDFTFGKKYYSERRDMIAFYLKDDKGCLREITKTNLEIVKFLKD